MKLHETIDNVLTQLADYDRINIDKFYEYKYNQELLEVLEDVIKRGYPKREEMENLQELYDELDSFIKFETNGNADIGMF